MRLQFEKAPPSAELFQTATYNEKLSRLFLDLCDALGVDKPLPKGSVAGDPYCFDKDIKFFSSDKAETTRFADFYKEGCFLIEAKQGSKEAGTLPNRRIRPRSPNNPV